MLGLQKVFHPELYQGRNKKKNYFEGWYYKQVSADEAYAIAVIPGVSLNLKDPHAFIQVIIANKAPKPTLVTDYFRFPLSDFNFQDEPFRIQVGKNLFSKTDVALHLESEQLQIKGHFFLGDLEPIEKSLRYPNIMGYFGYLSFMECYHGIVSMQHGCSGEVNISGKSISFSGGRGYIEKDWGRSFPKDYVWIQGNHFKQAHTAVMLSVAHIPFLGTAFKGFLCNLKLDGKEYRFATYNGSKIIKEEITEKKVLFHLRRKQLQLQIEAEIMDNGILIAPKDGLMNHKIKEGLVGVIKIKLMNKKGDVLYEDIGTSAGVEIVQ